MFEFIIHQKNVVDKHNYYLQSRELYNKNEN